MMQEARLFEQRAQDLFLEGLIKGTSHLALGQEAVAAGFAAALRPDDLVYCTYRGHVHTLLRGAPMGGLMAELIGRANGDLRRQGRLDAPDRRRARRDGLLRDRRGAHADRGRRGVGGAGARDRPGRRVLLRGRDDEHRRLPRGVEPRRRLAAPGRVRLREQPLHGVHADRRGDGGRATRPPTGRAAYGLEPIVVDGNDVDEVYETATRLRRTGAGGRRPRAGGGEDLPARRALAGRSRRSTGPTTRSRRGSPATRSPPTASGCSPTASTPRRSTRSNARRSSSSTAPPRRRRRRRTPTGSALETELWADGGSAWRS